MFDLVPHLLASEPEPGALRLQWRPDGGGAETTFSDLDLPDDLRDLDGEPDAAPLGQLVSEVLPDNSDDVLLMIDSGSPWLAALPWEHAVGDRSLTRVGRFSLRQGVRKSGRVAAISSHGNFGPSLLRFHLRIPRNSPQSVTHLTLNSWHRTYGERLALSNTQLECPKADAGRNAHVLAPLQNPLLRWSLAALDQPADHVRFLAPVTLSGDEPALVLENELATAPELALFAAHVGAWRVLVTAIRDNMPLARMLAHRVSECGPLDCCVVRPAERRHVIYTTPSAVANRAAAFLDRYTFTNDLRAGSGESIQWLQPAQRILERYVAESFEQMMDRRFESEDDMGPAWRGMLQGVLDARDELAGPLNWESE